MRYLVVTILLVACVETNPGLGDGGAEPDALLDMQLGVGDMGLLSGDPFASEGELAIAPLCAPAPQVQPCPEDTTYVAFSMGGVLFSEQCQVDPNDVNAGTLGYDILYNTSQPAGTVLRVLYTDLFIRFTYTCNTGPYADRYERIRPNPVAQCFNAQTGAPIEDADTNNCNPIPPQPATLCEKSSTLGC